MTDELWNHGYVMIVRNSAFDSSIRFCTNHASYSHTDKVTSLLLLFYFSCFCVAVLFFSAFCVKFQY